MNDPNSGSGEPDEPNPERVETAKERHTRIMMARVREAMNQPGNGLSPEAILKNEVILKHMMANPELLEAVTKEQEEITAKQFEAELLEKRRQEEEAAQVMAQLKAMQKDPVFTDPLSLIPPESPLFALFHPDKVQPPTQNILVNNNVFKIPAPVMRKPSPLEQPNTPLFGMNQINNNLANMFLNGQQHTDLTPDRPVSAFHEPIPRGPTPAMNAMLPPNMIDHFNIAMKNKFMTDMMARQTPVPIYQPHPMAFFQNGQIAAPLLHQALAGQVPNRTDMTTPQPTMMPPFVNFNMPRPPMSVSVNPAQMKMQQNIPNYPVFIPPFQAPEPPKTYIPPVRRRQAAEPGQSKRRGRPPKTNEEKAATARNRERKKSEQLQQQQQQMQLQQQLQLQQATMPFPMGVPPVLGYPPPFALQQQHAAAMMRAQSAFKLGNEGMAEKPKKQLPRNRPNILSRNNTWSRKMSNVNSGHQLNMPNGCQEIKIFPNDMVAKPEIQLATPMMQQPQEANSMQEEIVGRGAASPLTALSAQLSSGFPNPLQLQQAMPGMKAESNESNQQQVGGQQQQPPSGQNHLLNLRDIKLEPPSQEFLNGYGIDRLMNSPGHVVRAATPSGPIRNTICTSPTIIDKTIYVNLHEQFPKPREKELVVYAAMLFIQGRNYDDGMRLSKQREAVLEKVFAREIRDYQVPPHYRKLFLAGLHQELPEVMKYIKGPHSVPQWRHQFKCQKKMKLEEMYRIETQLHPDCLFIKPDWVICTKKRNGKMIELVHLETDSVRESNSSTESEGSFAVGPSAANIVPQVARTPASTPVVPASIPSTSTAPAPVLEAPILQAPAPSTVTILEITMPDTGEKVKLHVSSLAQFHEAINFTHEELLMIHAMHLRKQEEEAAAKLKTLKAREYVENAIRLMENTPEHLRINLFNRGPVGPVQQFVPAQMIQPVVQEVVPAAAPAPAAPQEEFQFAVPRMPVRLAKESKPAN